MAEYIDRDALKDRMADFVPLFIDESNKAYVDGLTDAYTLICQAPAADVRPVVRAAWQSWDQDKPPCKWYSCDYCGFHALSKSNYCPNCGAKMEGDDA